MNIRCRPIIFLIPVLALICISSCKKQEPSSYSEKIIEGKNHFTMKMEMVVSASPADVHSILTDFDHFPEFMPNCTSAEIIERNNNSIVVESKRFVRFLGKNLSGKTEYTLSPNKIAMRSLNHPLADFSEEWTLVSQGDGKKTRVLYTADSKLKIPMPAYLCQAWLRDNFKETLAAVEKRAAELAAGSKPGA